MPFFHFQRFVLASMLSFSFQLWVHSNVCWLDIHAECAASVLFLSRRHSPNIEWKSIKISNSPLETVWNSSTFFFFVFFFLFLFWFRVVHSIEIHKIPLGLFELNQDFETVAPLRKESFIRSKCQLSNKQFKFRNDNSAATELTRLMNCWEVNWKGVKRHASNICRR